MKTPGEVFAESNNRNLDEEYALMSMFIVSRENYDEGEFRRFVEEHAAPYDDEYDRYGDYTNDEDYEFGEFVSYDGEAGRFVLEF